jgi:hypothetical protein
MRTRHVGTLLLSGFFLSRTLGQTPPKFDQGPIQAELMARLNVRHLAKGASVFAKVTADWSGKDCILRRGSILEAQVETAVPQARGTHGSTLALAFAKAQCNGVDMTPFDLVLGAVAAAPIEYTNVTDSAHFPISFSNPHSGGMTAGFGAAGLGDASTTHLELTGVRHNFPMRPNLEPGSVLDIKGLKLQVGKGPNRSSVLSARDHDVFLDAFTQLLLVPASLAFQPSTRPLALPASNGSVVQPQRQRASAVVAPAPDFETCAPPGCAIDLPETSREVAGRAAGSIQISSIGYVPRLHKVIADFDDEEALAWLGPQELLLTFNPHTLIKRSGVPSARGAPVRMIRAVLFDAVTHNVLSAIDWEVPDWRRYLWTLDGGRVLVHVGNQLRIYGVGLKLESSITLVGSLEYVRIAPNGELMAVATMKERHSPELHLKLRDSGGDEPEEDVEVQILDKRLKTIAQAQTTSGLMPPTLLNEGQVKLLAQPKMRYRLAMTTWENKSITLALFESMCKPQLSSLAPDLLYLMTCSVPSGETEYRVLRADGKLVLRGKAGPQDVGHEAIGNSQMQTFALKIVHANRELSSGQDFQGWNLESEKVRVYRASDGKRLFAAHVDQPASSRGSYALSPDGSKLAVLAESQIHFFPVQIE